MFCDCCGNELKNKVSIKNKDGDTLCTECFEAWQAFDEEEANNELSM